MKDAIKQIRINSFSGVLFKMNRKAICVLLAFAISLASGCALCPQIDPQLKFIMKFDEYIIPLAKAFDVVADQLPPDEKSEDIKAAIIERSGNPNLFTPFDGYVLKLKVENGYGVILLCSPDGKEGIIEDVTCTTRPDTFRPSGSPCVNLLDVERVCSN
jgi:hypothetical protein